MLSKALKFVVFLATVLISVFFLEGYTRDTDFMHNDGMGYYMYLPATFIYHNYKDVQHPPLDKGIPEMALGHMRNMGNAGNLSPLGYAVNQYTYGTALMESPFFLAAHAYEKLMGYSANGFSKSYTNAIKISALFYLVFGLLLTYKILRNNFPATSSYMAVMLIFIATNLFWFSLFQSGMSHVPIFFLYAALMYFTIKVHKEQRLVYFLLIGLVAGIITITRPSDVLCLLIPLLYKVYDRESLKQKWLLIRSNLSKAGIALIAFVIPFIPQLIYWKALTGTYFYDSYRGDQSFNWSDPKIIEGLFYFGNGWLPYSPVMIFSILGMLLYKSIKNWAWCIWLLFASYVYVIYSWYCYNYMGGLGSRPMIHLYPLLAIPFAAFIQYVSVRRLLIRIFFAAICVFCIALNYSFSIKEARGKLESEEANGHFVLQTLFRNKLKYNDLVTYDNAYVQPDADKLKKIATLAWENFDDSVSDHYVRDTTPGSKYVYEMRNYEDYNPRALKIKYSKDRFKDAVWFKCSGRFKYSDYPGYFKHLLIIDVKRGNDFHLWTLTRIENKIGVSDGSCKHDISLLHAEIEKWGDVYYYVPIPKDIKDGDLVEVDVVNLPKKDIQVDNLCLEIYK